MESILYKLREEKTWQEYLEHKEEKGYLLQKEKEELIEYINSKRYVKIADDIISGRSIGLPEKKQINKFGSKKKRVIYTFKDDEVRVLKLLAFLLYEYDNKLSKGCYSFRKGYGAHTAIKQLASTQNISQMWRI